MIQYDMPTWRKSSFSNAQGGGNCVEVADLPTSGRAVRDSKDPSGPVLSFTTGAWTAFVQATSAGEFD